MSSEPRVALLADASVVHARRWATALAERGFRVRLHSLEAPPDELPPPLELVRLHGPPLPGALRYPLALGSLQRALRSFEPHLVDAHFLPNYGLLGALAGRHPLVVNSWGSDLLLARDPARRARLRFVLARADRVFVDAAASERRALALGARPARLHLLPWGVDASEFAGGGNATARRRRRAEWPAAWRGEGADAPLVVGSTRHLHPVYDVATLVRAWPAIARAHPGARCVVAGDGPESEALRALARSLGVETSLHFAGRLASGELARLLAGADLYVSTSLSDTTSLSLLEAMSAGAIPVVSDLEANREWVDDTDAELFPPASAEGLTHAVARVVSRSAVWEEMRRALRDKVLERGDRRSAMDRVARIYRDLLERGPDRFEEPDRREGFTAR